MISILFICIGLACLFDAASYTGDHEDRHWNYFIGALFLITGVMFWRILP